MSTLAQLPTDNLYKFIALSGLALILFGIYLFVSHLSKAETKLDDLEHAMARAGAEIKYLELETTGQKAGDLSAEKVAEFEKRVMKVRILHEENKVNTRILGRLNDRLRALLFLGRIIVGVGIVLTICGFVLWYLATQRPQDQLLQAQIKSTLSGPNPAH